VQHEGIEVRTVGPDDGAQLIVYANLREEVGISEWLEHGTPELSRQINDARAPIAKTEP
jgi:hypothetical protein